MDLGSEREVGGEAEDRDAAPARPGRWLDLAEAACALALVLLFFAPWLEVFGSPVAGHQLRDRLDLARRVGGFFGGSSRYAWPYALSPALYLIPTGAAATALGAWFGRPAPRLAAATALITWAAVAYLHFLVSGHGFPSMAYGAYGSLPPAACLLGLAYYRLRRPRRGGGEAPTLP